MAKVSVRGRNADGAGVQCWVEDGRENAKARPAGVHLLELEDGLILICRGDSIGHGSCKSSWDVWIYHMISNEKET